MPDHLAAKGAEYPASSPIGPALPHIFAKLDRWRQDFGSPMLIALSGGGDSMALCRMASLWAKVSGASVHTVSIDHGLRASSAHEAAQAIAWARALGLPGEVVRLDDRPAQGGLQAWARQARYQALASVARRVGTKLILIGHTWDDQVETICWRLARQSGLDGLAGIAELAINPFASLEAPSLLGRPLLELKRAELRAWLLREGQGWLEDESNQNLDFARIRTRKLVGEMAAQGVDLERIIRLAATADVLRKAQEHATLDLLKRCTLSPSPAGWHLSAANLLGAEPLFAERALGWLIYSLTEADHPPEADKLGRLRAGLLANPTQRKTLGGVVVARKGDALLLMPAPPRRGQIACLRPTAQSQWARLFAVSRQPHEFVTQ
ncbi:MAG: tRNA lysidine(34) synthetase TilS [Hyphomonadaceae bacterium]